MRIIEEEGKHMSEREIFDRIKELRIKISKDIKNSSNKEDIYFNVLELNDWYASLGAKYFAEMHSHYKY